MIRNMGLALVGFAVASCTQSGQGQAGLTPAAVDLAAVRAGGSDVYSVTVEDQSERHVRVVFPEGRPPRALVVFLHGAVFRHPRSGRLVGGDEQTRTLLDCLVGPALRREDAVVILPWSPDGQWWSADDTRFVLGLVRAAARRWPEASARRTVIGYSNGGIGAWYFARLYPEYFTGAVPIAANATIVGPTPLPVAVIHGTDDELFPVALVREAVSRLRQHGAEVQLTERPGGSHLSPCDYVPELAAASARLAMPAP